ncbi:MAG: hypothetical protein PHY04_03545 [Candidatus ainarchaeum sp.]|nr:hypothetical protein [Candidatus ainarchaeum sp.]
MNKKGSTKRIIIQKDLEKKFSLIVFIRKIFLEYKWFIVFFIPFLVVQLFHIVQQNWDTVAYVFGGKWFCGNQIYLELIRPPFPSFLNCVFGGGGEYSMILSTVFACVVYLIAIVLIYKKNKSELNPFVFALFSFLFPSILFHSNFGSDLLALSFLLLALSVVSPLKKGFFFGLSSLSRYNYLLFGLVLVFGERKNPKNILKMLVVFVLVWVPWMVFNYLMTGNLLFSLEETSFLNVMQKGIIAPFFVEQILIIGFFVFLLFLSKKKDFFNSLNLVALLNVIMFIFSGIKETRLINLLVVAIAFGAGKLFGDKYSKKLVVLFVLFNVLLLILYPFPFYASTPIPSDDFVKDCRTASDKWVFFYDEGVVSECVYDIVDLNAFVQSGGSLVLYDYKNFDLNSISGTLINRTDYIIIHSNNCAPQPKKYISGSLRNYVLRWQKTSKIGFYDYSDWVE